MGFPYYITMLKHTGEFRLFSGYGAASEVRKPDVGTISLYERTKSGVAELFYKNDANVERDLSLGGTLTGGGTSGQVAFWNGALSLTGDADLTFATDTLTATKIVGSTSITTPSLTDSGMTLGSVLFAGAGGLISQDNANLFWDDTNNRLGLLNTTPINTLELAETSSATSRGILIGQASADTSAALMRLAKARGTRAAPGAVQSGDALSNIQFMGATGVGINYYTGAQIQCKATELFSGTAGGTSMLFFTTPNTTQAAANAMTLFQSGGLSVGSTTDPGATGIINANTGFRAANAATSGNVLRGNGTNFISAQLNFSDLAGTATDAQIPDTITLSNITQITTRPHSSLTSLIAPADDHTQYALLAGRASGQILKGGTAASENLTLISTNDATRGKVILGNAGTSAYDELNERFGLGTATPATGIDTTKAFANRKLDITLANGANNDIAISTAGLIRIVGPSGAFSISGFANGVDGRILFVFNSVAQQMTIINQATSAAANRINTLTGADIVLRTGTSYATFVYDSGASLWNLIATN